MEKLNNNLNNYIYCEYCKRNMSLWYYNTYHKYTNKHLMTSGGINQSKRVMCECCNKEFTSYYMRFHINTKTHHKKNNNIKSPNN